MFDTYKILSLVFLIISILGLSYGIYGKTKGYDASTMIIIMSILSLVVFGGMYFLF
jgi:hypothetical protein